MLFSSLIGRNIFFRKGSFVVEIIPVRTVVLSQNNYYGGGI